MNTNMTWFRWLSNIFTFLQVLRMKVASASEWLSDGVIQFILNPMVPVPPSCRDWVLIVWDSARLLSDGVIQFILNPMVPVPPSCRDWVVIVWAAAARSVIDGVI